MNNFVCVLRLSSAEQKWVWLNAVQWKGDGHGHVWLWMSASRNDWLCICCTLKEAELIMDSVEPKFLGSRCKSKRGAGPMPVNHRADAHNQPMWNSEGGPRRTFGRPVTDGIDEYVNNIIIVERISSCVFWSETYIECEPLHKTSKSQISWVMSIIWLISPTLLH